MLCMMYVCMYACMYVCMYVYVCMHDVCRWYQDRTLHAVTLYTVYSYNSNSFKERSLSLDVGALTDSFTTLAKTDAILSPM